MHGCEWSNHLDEPSSSCITHFFELCSFLGGSYELFFQQRKIWQVRACSCPSRSRQRRPDTDGDRRITIRASAAKCNRHGSADRTRQNLGPLQWGFTARG